MKTKKQYVRPVMMGLAALLMAGAAMMFSACSSEDDLAQEPTAPQQPTETATKIHVSVGAGINDATTRSLVVKDGSTRTLTFTEGDKLYIHGSITPNERVMCGLISIKDISADGLSATFDGDLTVYEKVNDEWEEDADYSQEGDPMTWYGDNTIDGKLVHADAPSGLYQTLWGMSYRFQYNKSLMTGETDNVSKLMESAIHVQGRYNKTDKRFNLSCDDAIFNCTFGGLAKNTEYYVRFGYAENVEGYNSLGFTHDCIFTQTVTTNGDGTARFAFGFNKTGDAYYVIQLCTSEGFEPEYDDVINCIIGQKEKFDAKVYNLSRIWDGSTMHRLVNLSSVTTTDTNGKLYYAAQNGDVLIGSFSGYDGYVIIPDGATVTLSNVDFQAPDECDHAAIHCLGSANIILGGSRDIIKAGDNSNYPAIFVAEDGTLTISGSGELNVFSNKSNGAACIGGGNEIACGNIVIAGGTIYANQTANFAAAIGSGVSGSCGNITISDGTVTATGNEDGTGIGAGQSATCGNITISGGTVTATAGSEGGATGIGTSGSSSTCGNILIDGGAVVATGGDYGIGIGAGCASCTCGIITIATTITSVTATKGVNTDGNEPCIGKGPWYSTCKYVIFGSETVYYGGSDSWDPYMPGEHGSTGTFGDLDVTVSNNGKTWTLTKAN